MQQQAIMPVVFTSLLFSIDSEDNATINDLGEIKMGVSQTSQVYLDYQVMETKEGLSITCLLYTSFSKKYSFIYCTNIK